MLARFGKNDILAHACGLHRCRNTTTGATEDAKVGLVNLSESNDWQEDEQIKKTCHENRER